MLKAFIFCILCIGCTIGIVFLIKNYIIPKITQKIEPITVAVGGNGNSIAYSKDGISWSKVEGSDKIFYEANGISFNGKRWVAVGKGFNDYNIAYSDNGINWSPIKDGIFSVLKGVASNGTTWIAVGQGTSSSIAYSNNGILWYPVIGSLNIFSTVQGILWTGKIWVAVGAGVKIGGIAIAYSTNNGIDWIPIEGSMNDVFKYGGYGIGWNGKKLIAVGHGDHSIAYSDENASVWTVLKNNIFSPGSIQNGGNGIAYNGKIWVTVGTDHTNSNKTIAYSDDDGETWKFSNGPGVFSEVCLAVSWNGTRWIAVGIDNTKTISYSDDGITWNSVNESLNVFSFGGGAIASNFIVK